MLLGTLGASLSRKLSAGKGTAETSQGRPANMPEQDTIRAAESTTRAGQDSQFRLILSKNTKALSKTNLNLMVFFKEIIYLK